MYGALVVQLIRDFEDISQVNSTLDKIGFNIGRRIIEDFITKSGFHDTAGQCSDLATLAEVLSKVLSLSTMLITEL